MAHTVSIVARRQLSNESNITFSDLEASMNASHTESGELETNGTHAMLGVSPPAKVFAGFCSTAGKLFVFAGRDQKDGNPSLSPSMF